MKNSTQSESTRMRQRTRVFLVALLVFALIALFMTSMAGTVGLSLSEYLAAMKEFIGGNHNSLHAALLNLRLSRSLAAFATGASLAVAGVMMQTLLRNPLADPYVLGVSGGASVGALAAMLLAGAAWMVDAGAFVGAMLVALLLYFLARRDLRGGAAAEGRSSLLLLTGVIIASGCSALVTLMLSVAPDTSLRGMVFWLVGDLSGVQSTWLPWSVLVVIFFLAWRTARSINVLAMHDASAIAFGVSVGKLRKGLFIGAALMTASAVTAAGSVGFVGLIVPHACRMAFGSDHRILLPTSLLTGGIFLVLADTLSRTLLAPQQLPVGAVTAMIGVPVFLIQLHRMHRK